MKKLLCLITSAIILSAVFVSPTRVLGATATSKAGRVSVASGNLNVRKSATTDSAVVKTLKNGRYITLISKTGSFWRVEYGKEKYGYCHENYIKEVSSSPMKVTVSSGTLNVRKGAGTSFEKKASLKNGTIVLVLSTKENFKRVLYNGSSTGYVSAKYLSLATSGGSSSSASYSAVNLSVPDYKQTDSRWANVKIGNSGKTIAKIGCATTAIAMIESYRNGKTIYPDAMSKKLSYSSSGDLYWPSDYNVVTNSSGYLKSIYNILKQGKPVLFGAKTSGGSQHWVVIKGFKEGALSTSNFLINDPGSKSRKTLSALLDDYPRFYKYFYY